MRAPPVTLVTFQCLQEVTVEERKERSRAAPTIDAMEERKGGREHLNVEIIVRILLNIISILEE